MCCHHAGVRQEQGHHQDDEDKGNESVCKTQASIEAGFSESFWPRFPVRKHVVKAVERDSIKLA